MATKEEWVENFSQTLAQCRLFSGVEQDLVRTLARGAMKASYDEDTTLWDVGTLSDARSDASDASPHERSCVAYVMSGRLVMMRQKWVVGLLQQGDIVGLSGAIAQVPHTATVIATSGTRLVYLDQEKFRELAMRDRHLLRNAVRSLGERIGRINDMIMSLHRLPPRKEQVFNLLELLAQGSGGVVCESQEVLAKLIDAERATVSRAISALLKERRIEKVGEGLRIMTRRRR